MNAIKIKGFKTFDEFISESSGLNALPSTILAIVNNIKEISKNIILKSKYSEKSKNINLFVYVNDRESDSRKIAKTLLQNGIAVNTIRISSSSFPAHEAIIDNKIVRLIYKPVGRGGHHETTLNSTITELVPTILFNSKLNISSDHESMMKIIKNYINGDKPKGIMKSDLQSAKNFIDQFEESKLFKEKMENAYGIYAWIKKYESETSPIKEIIWAYRVKPEGIPKNTAADIIIKHEDGDMIGISLKAGKKSSKEPLVNSSVVNLLSYLNVYDNEIKEILWNKIYNTIVDLYNSEVEKTKINMNTYYTHGGGGDIKIFDVLEWYEKKYNKEYNQKYAELQNIMREYIIKLIKTKSGFNDWLFEKMDISGTFPLLIVKAINNVADEVRTSNKEEMAAILANNKIELTASLTNRQIMTSNLPDGTIMTFTIRSVQPGVKHKLGSFFNLAFKYVGRK